MGSRDDCIRFLLDGEVVEVSGLPATTTVLDWLRDHAGRTGTKEGCAEGDCGACTVLLGEYQGGNAPLRYRTFNSCIRFLPTIDGCELVTVESLVDDGVLHPAQRALVAEHGSQCGFCTPGFVMSLAGLYLEQPAPDREQVVRAIAGNLCRCTGYRPIIDAGLAMGGLEPAKTWHPERVDTPARRAALAKLVRRRTLELPDLVAPRSLDELASWRQAEPDAQLLAGGTDLGLEVTKALRNLPKLIYTGQVPELHVLETAAAGLRIGAAVPLADAWAAIVDAFPGFEEVADRFASPPVCHSGTLGGNVANGSPIGDCMPVLLALDARVELRRGASVRELSLADFYLDYRRTAMAADEFLVAITVPEAQGCWHYAGYKLGKRWDQDISAVCAGFAIQVDAKVIVAARLGFGGMAGIPARAPAAEAALIGATVEGASFEVAADALASDFEPIDDLRASASYRLISAGNLLRRFGLALTSEEQRKPLSVWEVTP